jgi:hypothetical protein
MRLQTTPDTTNFHSLSVEQLSAMLANKQLAMIHGQLQSALDEKTKTRAFLTVEILKNSNINPILETGLSRIQGKVVSAQLINPKPGDEMTFGFGDIMDTAKIGVFVQVPDELLDNISVATTNHVKFEVALTVNPEGGRYVLQAGEINELRSVYQPELGKSKSLQVWEGPEGDEYFGKQPPVGYTAKKLPSYGNVTVLEVLESNPVNLALLNAVVPEDKRAWLANATASVARNSDLNLQAYMQKRADQSQPTPENDKVAAMAATLETSEVEVKI